MVVEKSKSASVARRRSLITYINPDSKISEQFRTIRTNIQFSSKGHKVRTLLIASPSSGEGKSTITANLAISMAQQRERVLVIDADLRKPTMHSTFKINNTTGLIDVLNGRVSLDEATQESAIANLQVLTSGPVPFNPAEILGSREMAELIEKALKQYDIVMLDSPPVLEFTDAAIIANMCEGVILTLHSGKTEKTEAIEAKKILEFAKAKLLGVILNKNSQ